jgi:hypothetical protein
VKNEPTDKELTDAYDKVCREISELVYKYAVDSGMVSSDFNASLVEMALINTASMLSLSLKETRSTFDEKCDLVYNLQSSKETVEELMTNKFDETFKSFPKTSKISN